MTRRWRLVVLVLVYVTLDLALPSMPGAFVFDAGASVETVARSRSHDATAVISNFPVGRDPRGVLAVREAPKLPLSTRPIAPLAMQPSPGRRPARPDPVPSAEDAH